MARKKFLPYPRPKIAQSLELRFVRNSLRGGAGLNIGRNDAQTGAHLFCNGIQHLSDGALKAAVLMKHAGREARRYRALASA